MPVPGDWNADRVTTVGVYEPAAAVWKFRNRNTPGGPDLAPPAGFAYGSPNGLSVPVTGASGVSPNLLRRLQQTQFTVGNLTSGAVGAAFPSLNWVVLDSTAAGLGWFVDPTPLQDDEFTATAQGTLSALTWTAAQGHQDLLTVVLRELGHLDGLADTDASGTLMGGVLRTTSQVRRSCLSSLGGRLSPLFQPADFGLQPPGDGVLDLMDGGLLCAGATRRKPAALASAHARAWPQSRRPRARPCQLPGYGSDCSESMSRSV
jgi:hypothetical protein